MTSSKIWKFKNADVSTFLTPNILDMYFIQKSIARHKKWGVNHDQGIICSKVMTRSDFDGFWWRHQDMTSLWRHSDVGWEKFCILIKLRPTLVIPPSFIPNRHDPGFFWWGAICPPPHRESVDLEPIGNRVNTPWPYTMTSYIGTDFRHIRGQRSTLWFLKLSVG